MLKEQYARTIGTLANGQHPSKEVLSHLLYIAEIQPNAQKKVSPYVSVFNLVNHNHYKEPVARFERWKWIAGFENNLDKKVQQKFDTYTNILDNTQANSILQLKNKLQAYWYVDRTIKVL